LLNICTILPPVIEISKSLPSPNNRPASAKLTTLGNDEFAVVTKSDARLPPKRNASLAVPQK
jgi:hypothetical protein